MHKITAFLLLLVISTPAFGNATSSQPAPEGMVAIPAGSFEMGSRRSFMELNPTTIFQSDRHMLGPEDPTHEVITHAYFVDRTEVTNAQYTKYLEATQARQPQFLKNSDFNGPDQPVVGVNWKEAQAFCKWKEKRLPTEAEWEKAGRGQAPVTYPWGNTPPDGTKLNFNKEVGKTVNVGSYEDGKSAYGVYDLSGNVSEWVYDWHFPEYYLFSPKENPPGPEKGVYKVIRGGNWRNEARDVNLTYRNATAPKIRSKTIGFRCVQDVADSKGK